MAAPNIVTLDQANFEKEVLHSGPPVLVDFWAEWCGPCKMLGPILEELAVEFEGKARFGKVDIDQNQKLATDYGIRAVPTLLLFKGGQVQEQFVGLKSKRDLKQAIDQAMG